MLYKYTMEHNSVKLTERAKGEGAGQRGRQRGDETSLPTQSEVKPRCPAPLILVAKYVTVRRIHYVPCRGEEINAVEMTPKLGQLTTKL